MENLQTRTREYHHPDLDILHEDVLQTLDRAHQDGIKRGYLNMAMGLGKTELAARDINSYLKENPESKILYLCHNTNILEQASDELKDIMGPGVSYGKIFGGEIQHDNRVTFASFQQLNVALNKEQKFYELIPPDYYDYVVVDESHHSPAETYRQVIEHLDPKFLLGLTATPDRRDQQDMGELFGDPLYTVQLDEAIAKGYLVTPDYRVLTDHVKSLAELETELGNIKPSEINSRIFVRKRDGEIADEIFERLYEMDDPRTIVFCPSIEYAEYMTEFLPGNVASLHSELPKQEQQKRLEKFRNGSLNVLTVVDMLNEGVNVPEVNVIVFLRSTESRTVYLQQLGRGLRKMPGKDEVLVLDFAASWERIRDIKKLQHGVESSYEDLVKEEFGEKPSRKQTSSRFKFEFSEEALSAIEVVEYARTRQNKPKPIKIKPRAEAWDANERAVAQMLGLTELPNQSLTSADWQMYELKILSGDEEAKKRLFMRLLRSMYQAANTAQQKSNATSLTIEDYFQIISDSVYISIDSYNSERKTSLKEHLSFALRYGADRNNTGLSLIKGPSVSTKLNAVRRAEKQLGINIPAYGLTPEDKKKIAEASEYEISDITEILDYQEIMDDEQLLDFDGINEISRQYEDPAFDKIVERLTRDQLREVMEAILSYRERRVLELRYGLGGEIQKNLDEVGRVFNVQSERVRQVENEAIKKIASNNQAQSLREPYDPRRPRQNRYMDDYISTLERKSIESYLLQGADPKLERLSKQQIMTRTIGFLMLKQLKKQSMINNNLPIDQDLIIRETANRIPFGRTMDRYDYMNGINYLKRLGLVDTNYGVDNGSYTITLKNKH